MNMKFTIECEMNERWVPHFLSMLLHMEHLGIIGGSREVGIYSDGDGDFRPKFRTNIDFEIQEPSRNERGNHLYDAG